MTTLQIPGLPTSDLVRADILIVFQGAASDYKVRMPGALTLSHFAVHKTCLGDAKRRAIGETLDGYTLTHVPTGFAIATRFPDKKSALELISYLDQLPIDWQSDNHFAIRASARPLLRAEIRARVLQAGGQP